MNAIPEDTMLTMKLLYYDDGDYFVCKDYYEAENYLEIMVFVSWLSTHSSLPLVMKYESRVKLNNQLGQPAWGGMLRLLCS